MADVVHRRRNRRRRRRQEQRSSGSPVYVPSSQFPPLPPPWDPDAVKGLAAKRKNEDLLLDSYLGLHLNDLQDLGEKSGIEDALGLPRGPLLRQIIRAGQHEHGVFFARGLVEVMSEGHGFVRHLSNDYTPNFATDALLHAELVEKHHLQTGQSVYGVIAPMPERDDEMLVLQEVMEVFGEDPEKQYALAPFHDLVPLYPESRLRLETEREGVEMRIVDLISPVGKGQRGLIVAPPRTGKTVLLQLIANAIVENHPEVHLILLLVDERPEEVTDFERSVKGDRREIVASTFDEPPSRHVRVAEMVIENAKARVEQGQDVVILLDSITRLARAYNNEAPANSKIMTGGLVADALLKPKRFFGAARNIENGGSLTILATALIDTNSKMDEVIFEEFKGTGNMELVLERQLADRRVWPAIDINRSGTRKEDLLFGKDELKRVWLLRKVLNDMKPVEGMELLIDRMQGSKTNSEFLANLSTST